MRIKSLNIEDLRVIEDLYLRPGRGINLVVGPNGAGKTSILEAIYVAGRGRTFRHADAGPMIRRGSNATTVVAELERSAEATRTSVLGVRRERQSLICRFDGKDVKRRSELAGALPLQFISSQPQSLLTMGPEVRRRFIDMGLFHVEHSYVGTLLEFQQVLRQRNAAIRQGIVSSVRPWNRPLHDAATKVHDYRQRFVESLLARTGALIRNWNAGFELAYRYRSGWPVGRMLIDHLDQRLEQDLRLGYTTSGPQRAEVEILASGSNAERTLSRGQQKLLVLALNLALIDEIVGRGRELPIVLLDDLASELDIRNRQRMLHELEHRGVQAFLTAIEESALRPFTRTAPDVFHVEHGRLLSPSSPGG